MTNQEFIFILNETREVSFMELGPYRTWACGGLTFIYLPTTKSWWIDDTTLATRQLVDLELVMEVYNNLFYRGWELL